MTLIYVPAWQVGSSNQSNGIALQAMFRPELLASRTAESIHS
jgi:hypothetical protein